MLFFFGFFFLSFQRSSSSRLFSEQAPGRERRKVALSHAGHFHGCALSRQLLGVVFLLDFVGVLFCFLFLDLKGTFLRVWPGCEKHAKKHKGVL